MPFGHCVNQPFELLMWPNDLCNIAIVTEKNPQLERITASLDNIKRTIGYLARESGVSDSKFRNMKRRASTRLSAEENYRVAKVLGVEPHWLATDHDQPTRDVDAVLADIQHELSLLSEAELRMLLTGIRTTRAALDRTDG